MIYNVPLINICVDYRNKLANNLNNVVLQGYVSHLISCPLYIAAASTKLYAWSQAHTFVL